MSTIKEEVVCYAKEIGLDLIGFTTPEPFDRLLHELDERAAHYQERFAYRIERWQTMAQPRKALAGAQSVVVLGFFYLTPDSPAPPHSARVARIVSYGHLGILKRARLMRAFLKKKGYQAIIGAHRKEAAVRAGLGGIGKHNLVMNPKYGSWVAYQTIVTDAAMEPDTPFTEDPCGTCDLCLKACPTSALYAPRRLDPRKCVAYMLTSEQVPEEHFPALNNYILGCDACQDACPKNKGIQPKPKVENLLPEILQGCPPLRNLVHMSEDVFQRQVITPITEKMTSRSFLARLMKNRLIRGILQKLMTTLFKGKEVLPETFVHASQNLEIYRRNAVIALGNLGDPAMLEEVRSLKDDPYLRPYAAWAERKLER